MVPIVGSKLLDRSLIYTAITRAIDGVVLVGSTDVLRLAVERSPTSMQREVGLTEALNVRLTRDRRAQ